MPLGVVCRRVVVGSCKGEQAGEWGWSVVSPS
jgi:hypothetical protein